jgi:signal transduction histidine kinase
MTRHDTTPDTLHGEMDLFTGRLRSRSLEALVFAFATASIIEVFVTNGIKHRPAVAVIALAWSVPFLFRRRHPFAVPLFVSGALVLLAFVAGGDTMDLGTPFFAALLTAVAFGQLRDRRQALAGLAIIVGAAAIVDAETTGHVSDFIWTTVILALAWGTGSVLGVRAEQARVLRERIAAAERERGRITRELHDLVAHSVSSMVVQASAVRRLLHEDQERERQALLTVEQTGRDALAEMRRMVGVMKTSDDREASLTPQPGLKHLRSLIAQVENAGLPVALEIEGEETELSPGIDLSAYRVVQDALAGALEHKNGSGARVVVRYRPSDLELEITDGGAVSKSLPDLSGLRERVTLYGGTLDAQPRAGGGIVLRATLPVGAAR